MKHFVRTPDGYEFSAETAADAVALYIELRKAGIPAAPQQGALPLAPIEKRRENGHAASELMDYVDIDVAVANTALKFLRTVRDSAPQGVQSAALLPVFNVANPKAIGNKAAKVNRLLESLGMKPKQVYRNPRSQDGTRVWHPGKLMDRAINVLEQHVTAH